ncbi:MAG: hypothetical protein PHW75_02440 [Patescibacteria group bacterium]|nr:hypothetical protein [Patescibacteria group bacterium]
MNKGVKYRELEKIPEWHRVLLTGIRDISILQSKLKAFARKNNLNIFGYIQDTGNGLAYVIDRYPRKKYCPIPSIESLEKLAIRLQKAIGGQLLEEISNERRDIRAILGLIEGYDGLIMHTVDEVKRNLGEDFVITPITIFSLHPNKEYIEPAVAIEGDRKKTGKIKELAHHLKQHRFAIHDLADGYVYLVETPWCTEPD